MFELLYTSSKTPLPFAKNYALESLHFLKSWACAFGVARVNNEPRAMKIFHDGSFVYLADEAYSMPGLTGVTSRVGGRLVQAVKPSFIDLLHFYPIDEFVGFAQPGQELGNIVTTLPTADAPSLVGDWCVVDDLLNLYLHANTYAFYAYGMPDGLERYHLNWPEGYGANRGLHWAWDNVLMMVTPSTGQVHFVEYRSDGADILFSGKIDPCFLAAFDSANKVIFAVGTDNLVRIYYPKGVPDHFVGPTLSAATVKQFGSNQLSLRLLGDSNEPCEGWWITWSLLNDKGVLNKTHTRTDAQGYAYNTYLAPVSVEDLGAEAVQVEVEI